MQFRALYVTGVALLSSTALLADFQYQETTKITGGLAASLGRFAGKKAMEPAATTIGVKGNRMFHLSQHSGEITDLDKETITQIDFDKKTYSVMTFEQIKQAVRNAMDRVKQAPPAAAERAPERAPELPQNTELSFKASVKQTGQTKDVNGLSAKEYILVMQMIGTDKTSGQSGAMNITNDMWMATEPQGYQEIRDFQRRMGEKMGNVFAGAAGINPVAAMRPEMGKGMTEMAKEMSKLKGMPVMQITRMGATADGQPLPAASEAPELSAQGQLPSGGAIAGQAATSASTSAIDRQLGRLGGLSGLGGLGGFGRKKKQDTAAQDEAANRPQPGGASGSSGGGLLLETTSERSGFSSTVDASKFDVPAGFKRVERTMDSGRGR